MIEENWQDNSKVNLKWNMFHMQHHQGLHLQQMTLSRYQHWKFSYLVDRKK